jgi:hypothetical protein
MFWAGFGLVIGNKIEGVCVFGQPSLSLQKHAFIDRNFRLYELSRVVIQTKEKNAASFLIANALNMLPSPCSVVSFADTQYGHCGIIYQATNWIYTGSTISHDKLYVIDGKLIHPMTLRNQGICDPTRWAKEHGIEMIHPKDKHRYFYFVGTKRDKKSMRAKLKYPIYHTYPKLNNSRYDDGPIIDMPVEGMLYER